MGQKRTQKRARIAAIAAVVCIAGIAVFLLVEMRSFYLDKASIETSQKAVQGEKSKIVIGSLVVEEPYVIMRLGAKKEKPETSILEKMPAVRRATMNKGKVELSFVSSPMSLMLNDAFAGVSDFSPEKGGKVNFRSNFHFAFQDKRRLEMKGNCAGDLAYDRKAATVTASLLEGFVNPVGEFKGSLIAVIKEPFTFKASLDTPSLDLAAISGMVKRYLPQDYQNWSVQGKASAQIRIEGTYSAKALVVKGTQRAVVNGGGLNSPDGTKAVQGLQARTDLAFGYATAPEKLDLIMNSTLSGGEFLWGTYYRNFSGNAARANVNGTFIFSGEKPFSFSAGTDLFGAGNITVTGKGQRGGQAFSVDAKDISLQKLVAVFLDEYFKQNLTYLSGLGIAGKSSLSMKVRRKGPQTDVNGLVTIDDASFTVPDQKISVSGMRLNLPFDLGYPKAASAGESQRGLIEIKSASKGYIKTENISIPLFLSGNKLWLPEDAAMHIARGDIVISRFAADNILSPERKITFGMRIRDVHLRPIERSFTIAPISGTVSADFPKIEYQQEGLAAQGRAVIRVFGGEVEIGDIHAARLLSASRKINTSINFRGINLEKATEKIAIGKMTGIIQGLLKDFEIEYGQPARFVLDIDSVDTKGISQRISVEAIQNISILGTGSGMSGALNRGILSFFKDYPYSRIGIRATLENDVFTVRGKIHEGGTEYLVRRGFLRGVDVVNQNPDNKISFQDMQERIKRIFESRKTGGPVVQ